MIIIISLFQEGNILSKTGYLQYGPGSEKIALKWKNSIWIFWYLRYRFVVYFNERYTKVY